ncbi:hypothetical protein [Actinoplanes sp. NPDC049118]|uniref:hypothetical protein n=1 Tax=Actinoplanes sp. NPDC049118 TaxID=3155769 RepID=UPI00340D2F35
MELAPLEEVPPARHRYVLSLAPDGERPDDVPAGYLDFVTEALRHPEDAPAYAPVREHDPADTDGTSYAQWGEIALGVAASLNLRAGDRLLIDASQGEEPVGWLLAPLSAGASIVLCANLDRDALDDRSPPRGSPASCDPLSPDGTPSAAESAPEATAETRARHGIAILRTRRGQ